MKKGIYTYILGIFFTSYLFGQEKYKQIDYDGFVNERLWILDAELFDAVRIKDYVTGSFKIDSILAEDSNYGRMNLLKGALCKDKVGDVQGAIDILKKANKHRIDVCRNPLYDEWFWSEELIKLDEFQLLCPTYPSEIIKGSDPNYAEDIVRLFVWQSPPNHRSKRIINMGYEHLYETIPALPIDDVYDLIFKELDSLITVKGFPTLKKVGIPDIVKLAFTTIIHNDNIDYIEKFLADMMANLPGYQYAIAVDKIMVSRDLPQIYGTQYTICSSKPTALSLYETKNLETLHTLRMALGLHPIPLYEKFIDDEYK